ncbi:pyridoxal phosphate-dependent aminotransferase [Companilactobacillus sp.]|jgi:threonine-phosphate decarboxylase|uniref:pyridoxal phosphate-dependent aminotransferase n=1 Tax=Companilactobacillus sp. TaxID=2767905 RepID=UPI0025C2D5B1|nr:aminotransferase class I/II-fold pyridoxal phosphate-dependent enzyme [Companilactobacillus sp.]MCH4008631.1 aminotransferase class I/II-fold pyridoxal phosphate-dependent enzyme [Companilactobacillus sp.]MCH4051190.1 aminotransferase class I/II-fold pyridoxal phosphate-dependent enzyme [Companilactobacillus sp.]MCH4076574.1 aminotransferase class I/II-fold pyridoxal phosphate-dependent enzyme [Companilactobacillus sp.]MCH4125149.1 aminotransferase class I/II-fold pyridoxal phosphate-depende
MSQVKHGGYGRELKSDVPITDFSANINPLGVPEKLLSSIQKSLSNLIYYPDVNYQNLRQNLAQLYQYDMNKIWVGNGSVDLIFNIIEILNSKNALLLAPTFGEYEHAFTKSGAEITHYFLKEENDFNLDVNELINFLKNDHSIDTICLCNPNNPTGTLVNKFQLRQLTSYCNDNGIWLIIDEAFNDFIANKQDYTFAGEINEDDSVVIIKSLTKYYAIPGLRLGMALLPNKQFLNTLIDYCEPWSVNTFAAELGPEVFNDQDYAKKTADWLQNEKNFLEAELSHIPNLKMYPSAVNYYLLHCDTFDLYQELLDAGILIRNCDNYVGLTQGYYRIAVKSHAENQLLVEQLNKLCRR